MPEENNDNANASSSSDLPVAEFVTSDGRYALVWPTVTHQYNIDIDNMSDFIRLDDDAFVNRWNLSPSCVETLQSEIETTRLWNSRLEVNNGTENPKMRFYFLNVPTQQKTIFLRYDHEHSLMMCNMEYVDGNMTLDYDERVIRLELSHVGQIFSTFAIYNTTQTEFERMIMMLGGGGFRVT